MCECQEMSGFRQWAWVMVSKRRRAPGNVRTSCTSTNEGSKARLNIVQPRQSVWLPYQCRNWTATWSVLIVLLSQMSATERVLTYNSRDTTKVTAEPPNFMAFAYGSQVGGITTVFLQKPPMCNSGLTEPILTYHQWGLVTLVWDQFH